MTEPKRGDRFSTGGQFLNSESAFKSSTEALRFLSGVASYMEQDIAAMAVRHAKERSAVEAKWAAMTADAANVIRQALAADGEAPQGLPASPERNPIAPTQFEN